LIRDLWGKSCKIEEIESMYTPPGKQASARLILHKQRPVCNVKDDAARGPWGRVGRRYRTRRPHDGGTVLRTEYVRVAVRTQSIEWLLT